MKKTFTSLFILSSFISFSQNLLPNGSFETWEPELNIELPADWTPSYACSGGTCNSSASKTTEKVSGNYAVKVFSEQATDGFVSHGSFSNVDFTKFNGVSFTTRPIMLEFDYKLHTTANNSVKVKSILYATTTNALGKIDTIAIIDTIISHRNLTSFTHVNIPFKYKSHLSPSHLIVSFDFAIAPKIGGEYYILDEVKTSSVPTGLEEAQIEQENGLIVSNSYHLRFSKKCEIVQVFSLQGQLLIQQERSDEVSIASLPTGGYLVKILTDGKPKTFKILKN